MKANMDPRLAIWTVIAVIVNVGAVSDANPIIPISISFQFPLLFVCLLSPILPFPWHE